MSAQYIVGIDEAGRGPIAGPISVGAVIVRTDSIIEHEYFADGIRDSKKLTQKRREDLFEWISQHKEIEHFVAMVGSDVVDKDGINPATNIAIERVLKNLMTKEHKHEDVLVLLDGGLKAPKEFVNQNTIIKGDETELLIALASVTAKVTRDRQMCKLGLKYPQYGFEGHKGYGTKAHYEAIKKYGMCDSHRRSFLTKIN